MTAPHTGETGHCGLELSTNLREVSQCLETASTKVACQLSVIISVDERPNFKSTYSVEKGETSRRSVDSSLRTLGWSY